MAHSFGVARYATLAGLMTLITTLATTAGPFAAGLARTLTGSYTPALVGVLVLCAAAAGTLLRAARCARAGQTGHRPEHRSLGRSQRALDSVE